MVSEELVDGVGVVDLFLGRGFSFYDDKWYAVDHEDNVKPDVFVACKLELVGDDEAVVFRVIIVYESDGFGLLSLLEDYAPLTLQPFEEIPISCDVVGASPQLVDDQLHVFIRLNEVRIQNLNGLY